MKSLALPFMTLCLSLLAGCDSGPTDGAELRFFVDGVEAESEEAIDPEFAEFVDKVMMDGPIGVDAADEIRHRRGSTCSTTCGDTMMSVSGSDCQCGAGIGCAVREGNMIYEWGCDPADDMSYEAEEEDEE